MIRALVLGGAECMPRDAERALQLFTPDIVVAVNDAGCVWPGRIDHWVTLHPGKLVDRIERREANGFPMGFTVWAHEKQPHVDHVRLYVEGSSGLFGAKVALEMAKLVVLAGIPMDGSRHVEGFSRERCKGQGWDAAEEYRAGWVQADGKKPIVCLRDRVRSMSGWTRSRLGAPDETWLKLRAAA